MKLNIDQDEIMYRLAAELQNAGAGESEWKPPVSSDSGESVWNPEVEKKQKAISKKKILEMIAQDPSHVVTNLMLQRQPKYQKLEILLPLARRIVEWMTKSNISPPEDSLLYKETNYILDLLENIANKKNQ